MAGIVSRAVNAITVLLPKGKPRVGGVSVTPTFNPSNINNVLSAPAYRDHLTDIFTTRTGSDSRDLIKSLMVNDPDMSATVNAFLTVADTEMTFLVYDQNNQIDPVGQLLMYNVLNNLTTRTDYVTAGFQIIKSIKHICEEMRYMILAQGCLGTELILNKEFWPCELRLVDMNKVEWFEKKAAQFTPRQTSLTGAFIDLDIPTFFCSWFRQDPMAIYSTSTFVSAINTIAARQQVINDLYRIMQVTGYPRMDITVMEEVVMKNIPPNIRNDDAQKRQYVASVMADVRSLVTSLRPDQAFVHTDSIETGVMNEKSAGMALDIMPVINTLNSQNQAGLKVMSTIIGRGESGVNTASTEARIFSLSAEGLNIPIADLLSQAFTLSLRLTGSLSRVEVKFQEVELRPKLELEPQLTMRAARLKEDLSLGLITDEEYHLKMYNRLPPQGSKPLSGTGFFNPAPSNAVGDAASNSSNKDPSNSAVTPEGSKSAKSNGVKKLK